MEEGKRTHDAETVKQDAHLTLYTRLDLLPDSLKQDELQQGLGGWRSLSSSEVGRDDETQKKGGRTRLGSRVSLYKKDV